jgi:hypothetical protein
MLPSRMRNQDCIWQVSARISFLDTLFYAFACVNEEVEALVED